MHFITPGSQRKSLSGTIAFRGALVNERWLWNNMRLSDTEHTIEVIRLLSYLLYFTPASSHDDNILDR